MTSDTPLQKPALKWGIIVVLIVVVAVAGILYAAPLLALTQPAGPAPENDADTVASHSDCTADGATCCKNIYNLQESNRNQIAAPTVVDYSEATGNILVRGPEPIILRSGTVNTEGCLDSAKWRFAYDELNEMIQHEKNVAPEYFTDSKKAALVKDLQTFNLADYQFIDISLLNAGDSNKALFATETTAYGGDNSFSTCTGSALVPATIRNGTGNLIWSNTIGCPNNDAACIQARLWTNNDGFCSYADTVDNLSVMMGQKDPSGKKRLIYVHCNHGADRTGGIVLGYLLKANPSMSFGDAVTFTTYLGKKTDINRWAPEAGAQNLAKAYCRSINGLCEASAETAAGTAITSPATVLPTVTSTAPATPQPVGTVATAQTAVPAKYNPAGGDKF